MSASRLEESLGHAVEAVRAHRALGDIGQAIHAAQESVKPAVDALNTETDSSSPTASDIRATTVWAAVHAFVLDARGIDDAFDRLDVALALQRAGATDATLPHAALGDMFERAPISECASLFSYLETRAQFLGEDMLPTKGKGLVFLRLCNELLRRLARSYTPHAAFAGRILTLLSTTFAVNERSGLNLRGDFNTDNECPQATQEAQAILAEVQAQREAEAKQAEAAKAEEEDAMDEDVVAEVERQDDTQQGTTEPATKAKKRKRTFAETAQEPQFYILFWSLQRYFADPALVFSADAPGAPAADALEVDDPAPSASPDMSTFRRLVRCTLEVFSKYTLPRRKRATRKDVPTRVRESFYPKFLCGRALLDFELHDADFRRHVLLQFLITFQYLLSFSDASRERSREWKNQLMLSPHTISSADERWIRAAWRDIQGQLRDSGAGGREFLDAALDILRRENHWIQWKGAGAPSIEKPPAEVTVDATLPSVELAPYAHELGTPSLSAIWSDGYVVNPPGSCRREDADGNEIEVATDGLEDLEIPPPVPSLGSLNRRIALAEQRSEDQGVRQSLAWRALRAAGKDKLHLFTYMNCVDDVPGLLSAIDAEERGAEFSANTVEERTEPPRPVTSNSATDDAMESGHSSADAATERENEPQERQEDQEDHDQEAHDQESHDKDTREQDENTREQDENTREQDENTREQDENTCEQDEDTREEAESPEESHTDE